MAGVHSPLTGSCSSQSLQEASHRVEEQLSVAQQACDKHFAGGEHSSSSIGLNQSEQGKSFTYQGLAAVLLLTRDRAAGSSNLVWASPNLPSGAAAFQPGLWTSSVT